MNTKDTILVLTSADDPTADAVAAALAHAGGKVVRLDTGDFPMELRLSATTTAEGGWAGMLSTAADTLDLERVRSVFYWRPTSFRLPAGMSPADEVFAAVEARHGLGGLLASLDALWVNDPVKSAAAEYKPLQLTLAARCGLAVPCTLLSNVAADVAAFAKRVGGQVVCKPLSSLVFTEDGHQATKPYTTIIDPADISAEAFAATAHLVQEYLPKAFEARVTVVGVLPIAVAIRSRSQAGRVDWRADYDSLTYEHIDVPESVATGVRRFLERLGLSYGAFDFVITPEGRWVMLECNPAGQWLWLEHETGAPIAAALADLLVKGTRA
ncbi:ATP-grasp ribosomal peptide maturase [Micromonospora zamorensis]|uniref:ATP-grasp ribosomal peptide maturase n=3 Tax=Micromonospora TaxID=1873 RepID=A0A3N9WUJ6_9ACTN|nr:MULTISPECIES: ATP-grasp ribosomal peptide maturase [Micromonospora]RQW99269.1 ATP-grasp ribosomal peptide maturase [Micromonospora inaquosa]RQX04481.1 ATP-grasp ribosomal peptide maturase [Micromonospora arida]WSK48401.1 ATP-grasp ribosomal peptide maturase [Micromonospora zamorensis]